MTDIYLKIDGYKYDGFESINIVRSIEALAGRFEISLVDKKPIPVPRSGACQILYGDQIILDGYSDQIIKEINASEHTLEIQGRDKTADVIDCSVLVESQEMIDVSLEDIIREVAGQFNIEAIFQNSPSEKFRKFSFEQETGYEAIERACRLRGVFASSSRDGKITIRNFGDKRSAQGLEMGKNILSSRTTHNDKDRFSDYYVFGQQPGGDTISPTAASKPQGFARDLGVKRARPLIVIAEGAVSEDIAKKRAEWEASVRSARSSSVICQVKGWADADDNLWEENSIVRCKMPDHGIDGDMLIKEVNYSLSEDQGRRTKLTLIRPDAYKLQPDIKESQVDLYE